MLWVLKRTVSMRRFFWAPKMYVKTDEQENIYNLTLKMFVYLNLWLTILWYATLYHGVATSRKFKYIYRPAHNILVLYTYCIIRNSLFNQVQLHSGTTGQNIGLSLHMGESSIFTKSWTFELQILKHVVCLKIIINFMLNGQLSIDELKINQRSYNNLPNSAFWGWLSMESQHQNPELRNNAETFTKCLHYLPYSVYGSREDCVNVMRKLVWPMAVQWCDYLPYSVYASRAHFVNAQAGLTHGCSMMWLSSLFCVCQQGTLCECASWSDPWLFNNVISNFQLTLDST